MSERDAALRRLITGIALALLVGALLRGLWLTADPPTHHAVGIVWHDEGAWVHNARNRVLWGTWRTDAWNPVFIAPVFTGLEYIAFRAFGVGLWQARLVPLTSGLLAVAAIAIGLLALRGRRAAVAGALLLATNYPFVMWNRAALMESTMTAFLVAAWAAYALAATRPRWGWVAGTMATLGWFSKAAAAFFLLALALDAIATLALAALPGLRARLGVEGPSDSVAQGARTTLMGLAASAAVVAALFVVPHWTEYGFYNWQISVTRKPSYSLHAIAERASWLPLVQGIFSMMYVTLVAAAGATGLIVARWRRAVPAERLLVLWLLVGLLELVSHDAGNERRYVMFIPALVALAALLLTTRDAARAAGAGRWLLLPVAILLGYLITGTAMRLALYPDVVAGELKLAVRLAALAAVALGVIAVWKWTAVESVLLEASRPAVALIVLACAIGPDLVEYASWAAERTDLNYQASLTVGRLLPEGTLVHGKLANGLSLENRIRPVFVGRGFGNYDDRLSRNDVRYLLTYISPFVGYEGPVIRDVARAYPASSIVSTFPVAESPGDHDRAALVDKFGVPGQPLLSAFPDGQAAGSSNR